MENARDRAGAWSSECYTKLGRSLGTADLCIADYLKGATEQNEIDILKIQRYFIDQRLCGSPITSGYTPDEFQEFLYDLRNKIKEEI